MILKVSIPLVYIIILIIMKYLTAIIVSMHAGKLPIEVDANWVPTCPAGDDDFNTSVLPPPIPPKSLVSTESVESLSHRSQGVDYTREKMPVPVENEPMPALPPKPNILNIPPRPPK